jgi:putative hydrolase of the HAD superfamily
VQFALQVHLQLGRATYRLFDDVQEIFALVRKAGVPLALITNGASDTQRDKLRALGIQHWFDAVVVSGEVGIAKPDISVFRLALNKLAVECEMVWHVGDSLTTDVAGAKAADLTAVWLNRSGRVRREGDPEPNIEIRSLSNLVALLAEKEVP